MDFAFGLPLPDDLFTLIWELVLAIVVVAVVVFTSAASRAGDRELGQFVAMINEQARSVSHLSRTDLAARLIAESNTSVSVSDLVGPGVRLDGDTVLYSRCIGGAGPVEVHFEMKTVSSDTSSATNSLSDSWRTCGARRNRVDTCSCEVSDVCDGPLCHRSLRVRLLNEASRARARPSENPLQPFRNPANEGT